MATLITNQATLNYRSGSDTVTTSSNIATVTMQGPLEVTKYSLENSYQLDEEIIYNIFITNTGAVTLSDIRVVDDLGTYAITQTSNVTPLTYIGPAKIFIDEEYSSTVTGTVSAEGDTVTFNAGTLAAGSTMLLQYATKVNEYAGAVIGTSTINNIVSVTAAGINVPVIASNELPVASYAKVVIEKTMSPNPVIDGSTLTYTFSISNYGNLAATNIVLVDDLTTSPTITSVTINGSTTTDYSYVNGTFTYPATSSSTNFTIPAATITQDATTGVVTVVPATRTLVIQGTI